MNIIISMLISIIVYLGIEFLIEAVLKKSKIYKKRLVKIESQDSLGNKRKNKHISVDGNNKNKWKEKIAADLVLAGVKLRVDEYIIIRLVMPLFLGLIGFILFKNPVIALMVCGLGGFAPKGVINSLKKKNIEKFNNQLGETIMILTNSLRAGFTFEQAIKSVAADLPDPIGREFKLIVQEVELGEKMEVVMGEVARKMSSDDMELMNTAVTIQKQVGGNLADVLENIGQSIRDRATIKRNIKTLTAQGEISGKVIGGLPILVLVGISLLNPEYMEPLYSTTFGHVMLGISFFLEVTGFIIIKKLINIEM